MKPIPGMLSVHLLVLLAVPSAAESLPKRPLLLANYYCWYHDGQHPKRPFQHWTYPSSETNALAKKAQKPGEPPPNSVLRPLVGLYDSADPKVAEWHMRLAQVAGLDAFLVDWWGTHNALDQNVDRGIVAAAQKHGFKFALLDERAQFHHKFEDYQVMLAGALKRYQDHPAYLRIDGKLVVYLYQVAQNPSLTPQEFTALKKHVEAEVGPVYWIVDKIAHDAKAARDGDADREKRIPADWLATPGVDAFGFYSTFSNYRADRYDELAGKYRYVTKLAHDAGKKMLLPVHPGHDNSYFRDDPYVMPRRDGQTLRDYLRAATDAGADFIMVTSWNEWPESTVVEPSSSWPDPYQYLKILAEWKGVAFTSPPLPHDSAAAHTLPAISGTLLVEAEAFANRGGWVVDPQFMDIMGSPYLLAHGLGRPVADATTEVAVAEAGMYRVWGAVRVMRTCGCMGEVIGMAANLCVKHDTTPRAIYEHHLPGLQDLMRRGTGKVDGRTIPYVNQGRAGKLPPAIKSPPPAWLKDVAPNQARTARILIPDAPTSGEQSELLLNDGDGLVEDSSTRWLGKGKLPQHIEFTWEKPVLIEAARLVSGHHQEGVHTGPLTDFTLPWHDGSGWKDIPGCAVTGNQLLAWAARFTAVRTTRVRLVITATPDGSSRIWEVELYAPSQIPSR